ncbi:MAG: shikimate dehydrogenase [Gemmatimonadetes bacterium]|nr:shikimate dehydrogenase [Gemmatimonadota bacterium]
MSQPAAGTRLFALLGDPIAHSLSPALQNAAFRASGLDAVYLALRCTAETLPGLLRGIALAGGGGNITVPHKERAVAALDRATDAVHRTGACNTFWSAQDRVWGDNTDIAGFQGALQALVGSAAGARVLLLGAGGGARAALAGLLDAGVAAVVVLNRSPERAEALRRLFSASANVRALSQVAHLRGEAFDLVVNATPLGLHEGDALPLELDRVGRIGAVLDLVYRAGETPWVREARSRGMRAADGLEMLIQQGAAAFERWWGMPAPLHAMRAALPRGRA